MSDFDPDWPHGHIMRNGRNARIICKDLKVVHGPATIVALTTEEYGGECVRTFFQNGRYVMSHESPIDLINAPAPKRKLEAWVNFNRHDNGSISPGGLYASREDADNWGAKWRCACVRVECEEGDGL